MRTRSFFVLVLIFVSGLSCALPTAPVRPVPTLSDNVYYEISEIPDIVEVDETAKFVVLTTPRNECYGQIEYWDNSGVFRGDVLPTQTANSEGICNFEWGFDESFDIRPGFARFLVTIYQGEESANPSPFMFCITKCP